MRKALSLALLALLLPACRATLGSEEIQPEKLQIERGHDLGVAISATPSPSGMLSSPRIGARDLVRAIRAAVEDAELFRLPEAGEPADVELHAKVLELTEVGMSVDREATIVIRWTLAHAGGEPHWSETIETDYTAHIFNSELQDDRLLVAIREAARKNIREALESISRLESASASR